ncbi:hypothetical protein DXG03_000221 [Asterophora parasitica]|uniref:F-box domain-containing protein n=1 Tax=Asterophora parasitica TaxID=117018 RepID=A0A9P7GE16_9AGAR|nr:hypothetical protein DXG03_000221 [Asterophora parasitica]
MFESLPVELIAEILGELDLQSLISASYLSKRLHNIVSDVALNPWRRPILRALRAESYEAALKNLSVRLTVPRQNWIDILSLASPSFILYEATLPNLKSEEWEECFNRRFLPGWRRWNKDGSWKKAFLKLLHRVAHRRETCCTADESWTKYIVLNRNGSANELEITSRNFNPLVLFSEMKLQNNLSHLETRIRLVVEFADVRILAFGTLNRLRTHVPSPETYHRLTHPLPARSHAEYPYYTSGGGDKRWLGEGEVEEEGLRWVGGLMLIAQIVGPHTHELSGDWLPLQDLDLVAGPGRNQYASFTWEDLWAIAPWMEDRITKNIQGQGLG